MAPIDEALAAINSLQPSKTFEYHQIAREYGYHKETLRRRVLGIQEAPEVKHQIQSKLNPQQEQTLVSYINKLTEKRMPPSRSKVMIYVY
jgi:hypothetical protein